MNGNERVLVLGGGLAGVACARQLGDDGVEVTLVDRNDYHQFQPLLYQVASSQLPAEDIARPHRTIFKEYPSVDGGDCAGDRRGPVHTQSHARGREDVAGVAPGDGGGCSAELLRGARRRRARLSAVFGGRRRTPAAASAGTAAGRRRRCRIPRAWLDRCGRRRGRPHRGRDHRSVGRADAGAARVRADWQCQARSRLSTSATPCLGQFSDKAHEYALKKLTEAGADVRLGLGVTSIHPDRVEFNDGSAISTRTVVWGGGESGSAVAQGAGPSLGRGGRLDVRPDLTVAGYPGVYAVGDVANIPSGEDGQSAAAAGLGGPAVGEVGRGEHCP